MARLRADGSLSAVWLEVENNYETMEVTVKVWDMKPSNAGVRFVGILTSFKDNGDEAVIKLRKVDRSG